MKLGILCFLYFSFHLLFCWGWGEYYLVWVSQTIPCRWDKPCCFPNGFLGIEMYLWWLVFTLGLKAIPRLQKENPVICNISLSQQNAEIYAHVKELAWLIQMFYMLCINQASTNCAAVLITEAQTFAAWSSSTRLRSSETHFYITAH